MIGILNQLMADPTQVNLWQNYSTLKIHDDEKYQYDISIEAKTEKRRLMQKMTALTTLASKLSQKELTKLAHTIMNDR